MDKTMKNHVQLINIYVSVVKSGKFCRKSVSHDTKMKPHICEGRWYGAQKRTRKYGECFDWKTIIHQYVENSFSLINKTILLNKLYQIRNLLVLNNYFDFQLAQKLYFLVTENSNQQINIDSNVAGNNKIQTPLLKQCETITQNNTNNIPVSNEKLQILPQLLINSKTPQLLSDIIQQTSDVFSPNRLLDDFDL